MSGTWHSIIYESYVTLDWLSYRAEASVTRAFSADEVRNFVQLTGDANPIHANDAAAQAAGMEKPL